MASCGKFALVTQGGSKPWSALIDLGKVANIDFVSEELTVTILEPSKSLVSRIPGSPVCHCNNLCPRCPLGDEICHNCFEESSKLIGKRHDVINNICPSCNSRTKFGSKQYCQVCFRAKAIPCNKCSRPILTFGQSQMCYDCRNKTN
jgi:hypothetical protein